MASVNLKLATLCSVNGEEIKGFRSSGYREEKDGGGGESCQEEAINALVSVEAVRTLKHHLLSLRFR